MTVSSYLRNLSDNGIIRDQEKESIRTSIATIKRRLDNHFDDTIEDQFIFGSYTRNTILPRSMDQRSDIDYMIVFEYDNITPQSYLNRLKNFASKYYSTSEIKQSHPTIKLDLNHITFDLVPALSGSLLFGDYKIPVRNHGDDWISTNPNDLNQSLIDKNKAHGSLIKPLIRLIKYWNAQNGYIFESYELEKKIIEHSFYETGLLGNPDFKTYFFEFMNDISLLSSAPQWKKDKVTSAKSIIIEVKKLEEYYGPYLAEAEIKKEIKKLIPEL